MSGQDLRWFFDTYLRAAALPELVEERDGDRLRLGWRTAGGRPFPMPIEVAVDGQVTRLPMTDGTGSVPLPRTAHVVIDPEARVLRRSVDVERLQAWEREQAAAKR